MGEDKYLLSVNGSPQYQYLYHMIAAMGVDTYLSCTQEQAEVIPNDYQKIVDQYEAIGPIGGIASAIVRDESVSWLVVACDLINVNAGALRELMDRGNYSVDVVTYQKAQSEYYETTLTLYKPSSFPILLKAISVGRYSLQQTLKECKVLTLQPEDERVLFNANHPDDLV